MKKLSTLVKWSFVLPTLGQNLFIYLELYYMSYFLTDICQFPLNTVTFILTSTAAVDLVWVFVTGIVLEKCDFKKMGKYRAWYVIGSPIIILFFTLMFTDFGNSAAAMAVVVVAFCIKTLFQDIQSAAVTAQLSQISDSQQERTTLSVTRNIGSVAGQLLFSFVGVATITFFGNVFHITALGYTAAAIIFTIVNGICHIALYYITKDVPVAKTEEKKEKLSVGRMFKIFAENPPLLILSFGDLLRYTAYFLISSTAAYYFAAVLKDSASMSIYLTAQTCMGVVAALEENDMLDQVDVYGVDGSPDAKAMIHEGMMSATAAQFPSEIGSRAADAIYRLLSGESVEKMTLTPVQLITPDNVEEFGMDRWQ